MSKITVVWKIVVKLSNCPIRCKGKLLDLVRKKLKNTKVIFTRVRKAGQNSACLLDLKTPKLHPSEFQFTYFWFSLLRIYNLFSIH